MLVPPPPPFHVFDFGVSVIVLQRLLSAKGSRCIAQADERKWAYAIETEYIINQSGKIAYNRVLEKPRRGVFLRHGSDKRAVKHFL